MPVVLENWSANEQQRYATNKAFIETLAKVESVSWLQSGDTAPESATALVGQLKILIPLSGMIDKSAEQARLDKEMRKLMSTLEKCEAKLNNPNFVERAPSDIVERERKRVEEMRFSMQKLQEQADRIEAL